MLPGHGKTIMAAYLVGKRGRLRDVVTVGATVTITHTAGVLILGTLISLSATFAPTAVEQSLGVISGLIVVLVGIGLLVSALRRRAMAGSTVNASIAAIEQVDPSFVVAGHATGMQVVGSGTGSSVATLVSPPHDHGHGHDHAPHDHAPHDHAPHDHAHGYDHAPHDHGHEHGGHSHGRGSGHSHDPSEGFSRKGLIGLGAAGGLVPSPSALLVLLATIALGRTAFGVLLVLAYGLGMAGALTLAGLLLVKFRNRIASYGAGRFRRLGRLAALLPILTATLVIVVGLGLAARSFGGSL
jgi:ABC-type nickel/cobalt efflux system permease component RcnA